MLRSAFKTKKGQPLRDAGMDFKVLDNDWLNDLFRIAEIEAEEMDDSQQQVKNRRAGLSEGDFF